jgi:hypothetical protein
MPDLFQFQQQHIQLLLGVEELVEQEHLLLQELEYQEVLLFFQQ